MLNRIIYLVAAGLLLAGCGDALETKAEAERLSAQARADEASAALVSAQAISATLAAQTAQVERLAGEVAEQSEATRAVAVLLAGALAVLIIGGVVVAALALRRPVTLTMPPVPDLPHLADRPEYRAMYRAMLADAMRDAMQREAERRRALQAPQERRP